MLVCTTHGKAGEKREKEGKGRRKGRGKEWGEWKIGRVTLRCSLTALVS